MIRPVRTSDHRVVNNQRESNKVNQPNSVQGAISATAAWFKECCGIETTDPFSTDLDRIAERDAKKSMALYRRYPDLPLGEKEPVPKYFVQEHDPRIVTAVAYGASYPIWDCGIGSFWPVEEAPVWDWVKTVADVAKIKAPAWEENRLVQEMLLKDEELKSKSKYEFDSEQVSFNELPFKNPNTGERFRFCMFMTFIDLGGYLLGSTRFMELLALDHELARAVMEKCFEISTSYSDFMRRTFGQELTGLASLGGDNACMLSPDMYREYAMAFDSMMIDKCGDVPCNLHSCGPSPHLYDVWTEYDNIDNIVLMQTRAVPGEIKRLRQALPNTYLMVTMMPPQIDFENEDARRIEQLVWQFSEDAGYRDLQISAFISKTGPETDRNVRAFYQAVSKVNTYIQKSV